MKYLVSIKNYGLGILTVLFIAALMAMADGNAPKKNVLIDLDPDTLTTSTTLDTVTFTIGSFYTPLAYQIQVSADSLTGATGATCHIEYSASYTSTDWVSVNNAVVNGVTTRDVETGTIEGGRLRCRCYAPSSTQSTAVRISAQLSPRVPN